MDGMDGIEIAFPLSEIIGILVCLGASAFFSGSETALTHISPNRALMLMERDPDRFGILKIWFESKPRILATLLVGNNLVNILCSILSYRVALFFFKSYAEAISVFVLTLLILVLAEITPKSLALHWAEKIVVPVMHVVLVLDKLIYPISSTLSRIPGLMTGELESEHVVSEDEIGFYIKRGVDRNVFEEEGQGELLKSAVEFVDTMVKEVMVPRTDIFGLENNCPLNDAVEQVIARGHSRIPVFEDNLDHITGFLYAKDLLASFKKGNEKGHSSIEQTMRSAVFFVPETQKISQLLTDMRRQRLHIAIVVDEFGGTAGLVTLEDIIEELVGEISDEFDPKEAMVRKTGDGRWRVDARISIYDLEGIVGVSLPDSGHYESVGGFVIAQYGRIPKPGTIIHSVGFEIVVIESDDRHVSMLEIRKASENNTES